MYHRSAARRNCQSHALSVVLVQSPNVFENRLPRDYLPITADQIPQQFSFHHGEVDRILPRVRNSSSPKIHGLPRQSSRLRHSTAFSSSWIVSATDFGAAPARDH